MKTDRSKVLICDDSLLVRKQLRDLLAELHCQVYEAKNGLECVELYKAHRPGTVFLDIIMPECDGLEALRQLKELDTDAKVIMLSSTGTSAKVLAALKYGAADFIQKPYTKAQIAAAVGYPA